MLNKHKEKRKPFRSILLKKIHLLVVVVGIFFHASQAMASKVEIWVGAGGCNVELEDTENALEHNQLINPQFEYRIEKKLTSKGERWCLSKKEYLYCQPPARIEQNQDGGYSCNVYCGTNQQYSNRGCKQFHQNFSNCQNSTLNPVDLREGDKRRVEPVITVSGVFPIVLNYYYSNHGGKELTLGGAFPIKYSLPSASLNPQSILSYQKTLENPVVGIGFVTNEKYRLSRIAANSGTRYWRHNYESLLSVDDDNIYTWHHYSGVDIEFSASGIAIISPDIRLRDIDTQEENELGYTGKVIDHQGRAQFYYDELGRIRRIKNTRAQYHNVIYFDDSIYIDKIQSSSGDFVQFSYESFQLHANYTLNNDLILRDYPNILTDNDGRKVQIEWEHAISGYNRDYRMITSISSPYKLEVKQKREYIYSNNTWPFSMTHIYDIDLVNNQENLYAYFEYDADGKAILSSLAGDVEKVEIEYLNSTTRKVTNALGKEATYTFGLDNGARRLLSVTGEPTQNCLQSDTSFTYYSNGSTQTKTVNGVTTAYQYNDRGLETQRIEAQGTPEQKTITTEWHPTFTLPTKITQGNRVTIMTYDDQGRLQNNTISEFH